MFTARVAAILSARVGFYAAGHNDNYRTEGDKMNRNSYLIILLALLASFSAGFIWSLASLIGWAIT